MNDLNGRRGFTVVELGAMIALMGSLGAVLVPVGGQLQKNNLDTRSQWVHHDLARRQIMYMGDHKGAFTGPNTSGASWNRTPFGDFPQPDIPSLEFDTAGGNPTSQGDWITPLVGDAYGFSANRAVRTQQKFDVVADPTTTEHVDVLFTSGSVADADEFNLIALKKGYRQRSFLQIRSFTDLSSEQSPTDVVVDFKDGTAYIDRFAVQNENDMALTPIGYTPNIANIGMQPSNKIMFADGTRFHSDDSGLSIDIDTISQFVDDSDPGPMFNRSTAYGRESGFSSSQVNLDLSYRKQGGSGLYVTMFDGSIKYMTREETWTDPTPWYPSGSVWQGSSDATPESQAWVEKNLVDGIIH